MIQLATASNDGSGKMLMWCKATNIENGRKIEAGMEMATGEESFLSLSFLNSTRKKVVDIELDTCNLIAINLNTTTSSAI
jgi:hypothetical protein